MTKIDIIKYAIASAERHGHKDLANLYREILALHPDDDYIQILGPGEEVDYEKRR